MQADLWPLSDLARGGAGNGGVGTQGAVAPPDWGQAGPGGERGAVAAAAIVAVEKVVRSCGTIANHCCMCWQGCGWCAAVGGRWAHAKTWRLWRLRMEEQRLCGSLPGYGSSVGCGTTVGGDTIPGPGGSCSGGALAQLDLALAVDFVKWVSQRCSTWRDRRRVGRPSAGAHGGYGCEGLERAQTRVDLKRQKRVVGHWWVNALRSSTAAALGPSLQASTTTTRESVGPPLVWRTLQLHELLRPADSSAVARPPTLRTRPTQRSRPHLSCAAWRSRPRSGCHCLPRGAHAAAQVLHVCDQYHIRHCCRTQKVGGKARLMVRASWRRRWLQQWWRQAQRM